MDGEGTKRLCAVGMMESKAVASMSLVRDGAIDAQGAEVRSRQIGEGNGESPINWPTIDVLQQRRRAVWSPLRVVKV
jgi:hypothetical protein